jgi:DNA-directed RNA polymerase specialized sigma24 family protein
MRKPCSRPIKNHDVHGLEHREIASMEGCSLGNSKSQLHMARRALRSALSAQAGRGLSD